MTQTIRVPADTTIKRSERAFLSQDVYRLSNSATLVFDLPHCSSLRDLAFRNLDDSDCKIVLRGSNLRCDNLSIQGCSLTLDGLQNSHITGLLVANVAGDGLRIVRNTANCTIEGTVKRCSGYACVINSDDSDPAFGDKVRTIQLNAMPFEECKLGQLCVQSMSKFGTIRVTGRLNSTEQDGPPISCYFADRHRVIRNCDVRNMTKQKEVFFMDEVRV